MQQWERHGLSERIEVLLLQNCIESGQGNLFFGEKLLVSIS